MIGYLKGQIIENDGGHLIVGLSSAEGTMLGYAVTVPQNVDYLGYNAGDTIELRIHTHVREEALDLYGFRTAAEKRFFLNLNQVSGIGPKAAMGILSAADPSTVIRAIMEGDKIFLTRLPGIGKKTAERVILEVGDALKKQAKAGKLDFVETSVTSGPATSAQAGRGPGPGSSKINDACDALIGLGYQENEARTLLDRIVTEKGELEVQELVREALRHAYG